jgi:hypothetical protein
MFVAASAFATALTSRCRQAAGVDMDTEGIFWGAWGLLSFIGLIVLLRWLGPPMDQKKND